MLHMPLDVYFSRHTSPWRISNDETMGASSLHVCMYVCTYYVCMYVRMYVCIGGVDPVTRNCQEEIRGPSCGNSSSSRVISLRFFTVFIPQLKL
jgi:hypothetical protein